MTGKAGAKKVTKAYLERAALHYLGRFAATEAHLKTVLERKVRRRNEDNAAPSEEQLGWIGEVVAKCVGYGYVNDEAYAKMRAESLIRKGKPPRVVAQDLRHKGVTEPDVAQALEVVSDGDEEALMRGAAAAFIRRRRFGAFRRTDRMREDTPKKELEAMLRAGFPYGLARDLLGADEDELFRLLP